MFVIKVSAVSSFADYTFDIRTGHGTTRSKSRHLSMKFKTNSNSCSESSIRFGLCNIFIRILKSSFFIHKLVSHLNCRFGYIAFMVLDV